MKISVVTTLYHSRNFVREFYRRARASLEEVGAGYEIIFVNDGSPDDSLAVVLELCREDASVRAIDLSRNFGHHAAILAGLRETSGDYVFLIDVDLEEAPENLVAFYQELAASPELDMVYGVWRRSREPLGRRLGASLHYTIFNLLSDTPLPRNVLLSRLMTRRYVDAVLESWQFGTPPAPLMASIGFGQQAREVQRVYKGSSTYSVARRVKLLMDSITSFSARPLQYIFFAGLAVCALAMLATALAIASYFAAGTQVAGWYSVFVSVWFIGGMLMMSMGVLGLYVARIFDQVKGRPMAIVRQRYQQSDLVAASRAGVREAT